MTVSVEAPALELACALASDALKLARLDLDRVDAKHDAFDLVTSADRAIEAHLRARIEDRFPSHAVLGEEGGLRAGSSEWMWVLDPIDGTLNFATGLAAVACSIALLRGDEIRVAAVAELGRNTVYSARAGAGVESERGRVVPSSSPAGRARLFLDYGGEVASPAMLQRFAAFAEAAPVVPRLVGSAAVGLLSVALGGGCFAGVGLQLWDVAGAVLLATEASREARWWKGDDGALHLLAGDAELLGLFEPAMCALIDHWEAGDSAVRAALARSGQEGELG